MPCCRGRHPLRNVRRAGNLLDRAVRGHRVAARAEGAGLRGQDPAGSEQGPSCLLEDPTMVIAVSLPLHSPEWIARRLAQHVGRALVVLSAETAWLKLVANSYAGRQLLSRTAAG
jgi:hypothetical protein